MIVGIHQPNFFPWLGFFDKMVKSDVFILLDTVQYTKEGYQNRVQIKGPTGPQWLTVPVMTKGRMGQVTSNVEINEFVRWRRIHIQTFNALYRRASYYSALIGELSGLYKEPARRLIEVSLSGIKWVKQKLNIETQLVLASELGRSGSGSALLLDLVKAVGGTVYLSGPSGRNYLDEALFSQTGIRIDYHSFTAFTYTQRFEDFVPRLSVLDYLFNVGPVPWW